MWNAWSGSALALDVAAAAHASDEALAERQAGRLGALLVSIAERSPLYREIVGRRDPARLVLADLPVMTRHELMARFDEWVADPALRLAELREFTADPARIGDDCLGRYSVWESSGSSGEPGVYVHDAPALALYDLLDALRRPALQPLRRTLDPWYLGERFAFVGATTGHFASTAWLRRLGRRHPWAGARMQMHSFLQPAATLCAALEAQAPTVLATYPSVAWMLAEQAAAGRLHLPLQEVWLGGETLTPALRVALVRALGCPVAQSYGASEFLTLGFECRLGKLHLNSDWAILESVDARYRPVPAGQAGATTLLTNLANHVQPIVRYELGDRVTLHPGRCACGLSLPVIEVQGRTDDSLPLTDDRGRRQRLSPLALTTVLEDDAGLFEFQLVQTGPRALRLSLPPENQHGLERGCAALRGYLEAQGLSRVEVQGRHGSAAPRGRSGKAQRVVAGAGVKAKDR